MNAHNDPERRRQASLWERGRRFLGVDVAILGGAMTWISERNLVSSISNGGGCGVLACGSLSPEQLTEEITATRKMAGPVFGVNLIIMHPQFDSLIEACLDLGVTFIVLGGGIPSAKVIARIHAGNSLAFAFASSLGLARRLLHSGADALIIEGSEAGGHIGSVSTSVLAQEILPHLGAEAPIFVAGGIGRGEGILTYLEMGAIGCQLGTRFVCATESIVHPAAKSAYMRAPARRASVSLQLDPRFPVIPVRSLANQARNEFLARQRELIDAVDAGAVSLDEARLEIEHFWAGSLRKGVIEGNITHGSLMAGQSVGFVTTGQPTAAILAELTEQIETALEKRNYGYIA